MPCSNLVAGCFAGLTAPFASHPADQQRAFAYLTCCREHRRTWEQASAEIVEYLEGQGATKMAIATQLDIAKRYLEPWLG